MSKWIQWAVGIILLIALLIFTACDIKNNDDRTEKTVAESKVVKVAYIKMPDDSILNIKLAGWSPYEPYAILIATDGTKYRVAYENFIIIEEKS